LEIKSSSLVCSFIASNITYSGEVDAYAYWDTKQFNIDVIKINVPKELQQVLKLKLGMPDFYGMNWDAFWDGITGLIQLPDMLILEGWHIYKKRQSEDAQIFERIMKRYNELKTYKFCECIYKYYD